MPDSANSHRPSPGLKAGRWLALGLALALAGGGLAYGLGWRLQGHDRHPTWPGFPHLSNPRLVVEQIPDFAARYGRRYHLPDSAVEKARPVILSWFEDYYRTNLKNVRTLGYQRTCNTFTWEAPEPRRVWASAAAPGHESPPRPPVIAPGGYEYLELSVAEVKGYFKEEVYEKEHYLACFYQYNYPAAATDTLFLRYANDDYRVYVR